MSGNAARKGQAVSFQMPELNEHFAMFITSLAFGLAAALASVSAREVTSGFFRVQLWILLGLNTLGCLLISRDPELGPWAWRWLCLGAMISYLGSVLWLYDQAVWGKCALWLVLLCEVLAAVTVKSGPSAGLAENGPFFAGLFSGGLLLGWTMTAMLLGHWYLNTPTMQIRPLRALVLGTGGWLVVRVFVECCLTNYLDAPQTWFVLSSLGLRWLAGLLGLAVMLVFTWQTLRIPNTQSATGILYVAVVLVLIGELTSTLLGNRVLPEDSSPRVTRPVDPSLPLPNARR